MRAFGRRARRARPRIFQAAARKKKRFAAPGRGGPAYGAVVPHPIWFWGVCDLCARAFFRKVAGSGHPLRADRAGAPAFCGWHPGRATCSGLKTEIVGVQVDRGAVLCAVFRGGHRRDDRKPANTLADGMATRIPRLPMRWPSIRKGASRHRGRSPTTRVGAAIRGLTGPTPITSPKAAGRRGRSQPALQEKKRLSGKRVGGGG